MRSWTARLLAPVLTGLLLAFALGGRSTPAKPPPAPLHIVATVPRGETEPDAAIQVRFSAPMVPLGALDPDRETGRRYLAVEPEPDGYYHWVGTRTLTYVVRGDLPRATRFAVRVPEGLRSLDGEILERGAAWEFFTPGPRLLASYPMNRNDQVRPDEHFLFLFDQPVEPLEVARFLRMNGVRRFVADRPDSAFRDMLTYVFKQAPEENLVRVRPVPGMQRDRKYTLELPAGLRGTEGSVGMARGTVIRFRTYGPFRYRGMRGTEIRFSNPVLPDSLRAYLTLDPPLENLWLGTFPGTEIGLRPPYWESPAGMTRVRIRAGLPDVYGQRLKTSVRDSMWWGRQNEPHWKHLSLVSNRVRLLSSPRKVNVRFTGYDSVVVRALPLDPLAFSSWNIYREPVTDWPLVETVRRNPDTSVTVRSVDMASLFQGQEPGGLQVETLPWGAEPPGPQSWLSGRQITVQWTDLGAVTKGWANGGLAWVFRLSTGEPVPGAVAERWTRRGGVHASAVADGNGLVRIPDPVPRSDPRSVRQGVLIRGEPGSLTLQGGWYGGLPDSHTAYAYTDRPLYRPGETIHMTGVVRRSVRGGLAIPSIREVHVRYRLNTDREEEEAKLDTLLVLDALGGFDLDVATRPDVVGYASFRVERKEARPDTGRMRPARQTVYRTLCDVAVEVAAYRAPSFHAQVVPRDSVLFAGDPLTATVTSAYFFGAPLAGQDFSWRLFRRPATFRSESFPEFRFRPLRYGESPEYGPEASGEGTLDSLGTGTIRADVGGGSTPFELNLEAYPRAPSREPVGGRCTVRWFPARVLAGLHTSARYATAGDTVRVGCLAVDPVADGAVPGRPLELRVYRRVGRDALEEFARGRFRWQSDWTDTLVEQRFLISGLEPVTVPWPLTHPGTYRFTLAAEDARGTVSRSELRVTATGRQWARWSPEGAPELELAADKDLYRVGDTARVVLESPVRGNWALVTVEADSVLSARVVDLRTYPGYFAVPIESPYWPNVFVKVHVLEPALTRAEAPNLTDAERLPISLFGQVNLPLDLSDNRLDVAVSPGRKTYAPGDSVAITVRVSGPKAGKTRVSLAVVDRAVLALLDRKPPDPFSHFCRERRSAVQSWSSATILRNDRGMIRRVSQASSHMGFGGYSAFGSRFPVRKDFATTAYWNPGLVTDATGTARATFVLPGNLTEYEVLAVALGTEAFGVGESGFVASRPLVLEPVLPRFVGVGDTVRLAVQVTNATAGVLKGTIRARSTLRLLGTDARTVRVEAGKGALVAFPAVCLLPDSARVRFTGDFGYVGDAVERTLPVRDPRVEVAAAFAGITDSTAGEGIALPPVAIPGTETLNLALAASSLAGADQAFAYVMNYPYGCLEQTASRLLALTLYRKLLGPDRLPDIDRKIHYTVRRLQRDFGEEAGFWPGMRDRNFDHATYFRAYATLALLHARGHPAVSDSLLGLNLRALNAVWDHGPHVFSTNGWEWDNPRGFIAFVISEGKRAGLTTASDATLLHGLTRELPYWSGEDRIFGALALVNHAGAGDTSAAIWERTADRFQFTARDATCPSLPGSLPGAFRTETRATALALLLGTRAAPGDPRLDLLAQGLIRRQRNGHWRTTHDDVFALLALTAYQDSRGSTGPMTAAVLLDGTEALKNRFSAGSRYLFRRSIPVRGLAGTPGSRLEFRVEEGGPVYFTGTLRWEESVMDRHPREGGLSLVRRIQSLGESETPGLGDPVAVILEIAVERECAYLALRDPLPAGLEAIQARFLPEPGVPAWKFSRAPAAYPCLPVTHVETLDSEVRVFTGRVPPGVYEYRCPARVRAAGSFVHPPATVEAMYEPEFNAASGVSRFTVPGP